MKTKRRSVKRTKRRTKRGGEGGLAAKAELALSKAGTSAAHLGLSVVNFGSTTLETASNAVNSGEIIVKSLGLTTLNLSNAVSGTLVGTSFTINQAIRGFFGLNILICKSILVSSKLADLILNKTLSLLSEDQSLLIQIHGECKSTLNKAGTEQLTIITPKQCTDKYLSFLKSIHDRYTTTCNDMRKRMLKRIKNIFLLIKLKMIQIGCKKYWFSDKYTCRKKTGKKSYFGFQITEAMMTLNTVNEKIVDFGKMYHRLNSEYAPTIQSIYLANIDPFESEYSSILGNIKKYTGDHPNDYAYKQIQEFRNKFTELKFELQLTEGVEGDRGTTLKNVIYFLELLNKHISDVETQEYRAELEKRQKNENKEKESIDIEKMGKIENEQTLKQTQFNDMVKDVAKIPDNNLDNLDSSVDNKIHSQSGKMERVFEKQYNQTSPENSSINQNNVVSNVGTLYNNSSSGS
jgi:hypothetical protein